MIFIIYIYIYLKTSKPSSFIFPCSRIPNFLLLSLVCSGYSQANPESGALAFPSPKQNYMALSEPYTSLFINTNYSILMYNNIDFHKLCFCGMKTLHLLDPTQIVTFLDSKEIWDENNPSGINSKQWCLKFCQELWIKFSTYKIHDK